MPYSLTEMLDEIEKQLNDTTNLIWSTTLLTRAVRAALQEINRYYPRRTKNKIDCTAKTREYSLTSFTNLLALVDVWYPYDSADPYPVQRPDWSMIDDDTLYLDVKDDPLATEDIRIFYLASHTINGLDSETSSTLSKILEELVIEGACAHACAIKAADVIGEINVDTSTPVHWREEADRRWRTWYNRIWRLRRDPSNARAGPWPVDKWESQQ